MIFLLRCLPRFYFIFLSTISFCRFLSLNSSRLLPQNKYLPSFFFLIFFLCAASKVMIPPVVLCVWSWTCTGYGNSPRSVILLFVSFMRRNRSRIKTNIILIWMIVINPIITIIIAETKKFEKRSRRSLLPLLGAYFYFLFFLYFSILDDQIFFPRNVPIN